MKIAYFTDTYIPEINGVTNTLKKLSEYLDKNGVEYIVFAPAYNKAVQIDGKIETIENNQNDSKNIYRYKGFNPVISPESCLAFPNTKEIFNR